MNHRRQRTLLWLALLAAGAVHAQSQSGGKAQGATIVVGMGAEHTDNAYKSAGDDWGCDVTGTDPAVADCIPEDSETKTYVDVDLGFHREGEAFLADVLYNGEFAHYEDETTDDDTVIQGRSEVAWRALPGRLEFSADHERSEQLQDARSPDIRNNKQLRDIISAGPTFSARMSPVDDLVFSGRWYDVSYDDSDREDIANSQNPDSERLQGGISWQHRLRQTDMLSLSYQYMETEFDDGTEDFTYERLFGTYAVELRNSGYSVSLGANTSEREQGDSNDGFLAEVAWHLENAGHRLRAVAINELTDSGMGLGGNSLVNDDFRPQDGNFDVIDVVERTSVDLGYGYDRLCERCTVDVGLSYDEQDFDTQPRDQESAGLRAAFRYRLTSTMTASLTADYSEIDYPQDVTGDRTDERSRYGANLDWRISRSLSSRFWLVQDERDSDAPGQEYEEFVAGASVRYQFR